MRIQEGRIGRQETVAMLCMAIYVDTVFTLNSARAYGGGNSTYIWLPVSILIAMCAVLLPMRAMEKAGLHTLDELLAGAFGRLLGRAAGLCIIGLMLLNVYLVAMVFVNLIHNFVFFESSHWAITIWVTGVMFLLCTWGLECISRTALILGPLVGVVLIASLAGNAGAYSLHRLYPLPGNTLAEMAEMALAGAVKPFGAIAGLLTVTRGVQGMRFGRRACIAAAVAAAALALCTQLAAGLTYGYADLRNIPFPMHRLGMMLVREGYFFRMDTLLVFLWLMAAMVAGAYHLYAAAAMWCRCFGPRDVRPGAAAFAAMLCCAVVLQAEGYYSWVEALYGWLDSRGWAALLLPLLAAAIQLVKCRRQGGAQA